MRKFCFMSTATVAIGLLAATLTFGTAQAATVNTTYDFDPAYETVHGIRSNTSTYNTDFAGMLVTAKYTDGSSETLTWTQTGPYAAGISGGSIGLSFVNYGFSLVSNTRRLGSLALNMATAGTIFDASFLPEGAPGNTPTTKGGSPFQITGGTLLNTDLINISYSGLVKLAGYAPGIDAFTHLLIDFSQTSGGGLLGAFSFNGDTDALFDRADLRDLRADLTAVPLPAGFLLLIAGLGALAMLRATKNGAPVKAPLLA